MLYSFRKWTNIEVLWSKKMTLNDIIKVGFGLLSVLFLTEISFYFNEKLPHHSLTK